MKVIFLDVDGVLNNDFTKETFFDGDTQGNYTGVDKRLSLLFLEWIADRDYLVVLSSTWRHWDTAMGLLRENGITWEACTPRGATRGHEIQVILDQNDIEKYAILDDMHPDNFLKHQRRYLVQTSAKLGLRKKNLVKIDKLMGWDNGALGRQDRDV